MKKDDDVKALSKARFNKYAAGYVKSERHARGQELSHLLKMVAPQGHWSMLDIATGGGHVALKFAPYVQHVSVLDAAPEMLAQARSFLTGQGAQVDYIVGDAEHLPLADESFHLVTCRIAPHHFPDVFRFVRECTRLLKPGGYFLVQDIMAPPIEKDARYFDAFQRLRDPSHHRCYAKHEWEGMFMDAGLTIRRSETFNAALRLVDWAKQQEASPAVIERLQLLLLQAPASVAEHLRPAYVGTEDAIFQQDYIILLGHKAES